MVSTSIPLISDTQNPKNNFGSQLRMLINTKPKRQENINKDTEKNYFYVFFFVD